MTTLEERARREFEHWWGTGGWDEPAAAKRAFESGWQAARLLEAQRWHFQEVGEHDCKAVIETSIENVYPSWPRGIRDCEYIAALEAQAAPPAPKETK